MDLDYIDPEEDLNFETIDETCRALQVSRCTV